MFLSEHAAIVNLRRRVCQMFIRLKRISALIRILSVMKRKKKRAYLNGKLISVL